MIRESLRQALIDGAFLLDLDERDMASVLRRTVDYVVARGVLPAERRDEVEAGFLDRERQASTAIGNAVAVPHTYLNSCREPIVSVGPNLAARPMFGVAIVLQSIFLDVASPAYSTG